ncbi:hypothetical protein Kpol_534p3 [Vanderwaltozyma polyspora DSM 70294]|uniref:Peroxisomal membrane protein PEX14 n=1 Tax=Vanderwaltozyma polyspora (strain ATCC 22028 / DSM 70294 / BCRC 21397 / CBS 2163 / NBRC 10782 / NRRL Y-8283 / UCD 57-17) TaxID=436907 RepID=A7TJI1_VANPO|nr:uncharacterized protein Kpol_534p3 [Vanderwaltozyma polyspora DSM 70294]EDO17524.1 hypothetical protein Kpol_534p3 [Vanderwaltozyma polyspora DSM 70294]
MSESVIQSNRKELLDSAVSFLNEPSVANAPLEKKIEFLKSKGLSEQEIEQALKVATDTPSQSVVVSKSEPKIDRDEFVYESLPPPLPARDWRDYFIMATATAGLFYGVYEVTKRYVLPNVLPESKTKLEQDKEEIKLQLEKVDSLLNAIEQEHNAFKSKEEEKMNELDHTMSQLQTALDETSKTRAKMEYELENIKSQVGSLQSAVDKFISTDSSSRDLESILKEIDSLKNLIKISGSIAKNDENSESNGNGKATSFSGSSVPGIDTIPSASEVLAKIKLGNKDADKNVPAWMKNKEQAQIDNSIPEWQKNALSTTDIPDWQTTVETAEAEENGTTGENEKVGE